MNEVLKTISERYACRNFNDRKPSDEQLDAIAKAAIASPSGRNLQMWRVVVVKDKKLMEEIGDEGMKYLEKNNQEAYDRMISRGGTLFYNAPTMIVIPANRKENVAMTNMDCGIVAQNVALAATSLGLANVICVMAQVAFLGEKGEDFKKRLKFPEGFEFGICVLIGYTDKPVAPHKPDESKIIIVE